MKVTQKMYEVMKEHNPGARNLIAGLEAVLKDVPEVREFRFAGHPDSQVFLHSTCGTVVDAVPGRDGWDEIQAGECDCENNAPWFVVYVKEAKA